MSLLGSWLRLDVKGEGPGFVAQLGGGICPAVESWHAEILLELDY